MEGNYALPQSVVRNLSDRLYEKRKQAALEVESMMKDMLTKKDWTGIDTVLDVLIQDFACSTHANYRKGGLIGLAATAVGLAHQDTSTHLKKLVPPVLVCFSDPDSRVRYYACESLYNIAKVARGHTIEFFNDLFDGLCKLSADSDPNVKNGAQLLDRLVKDIVAETEAFDIHAFVPLLRGRIKQTNPFIRQFLIGWITMLDSVPEIDLIDFLPDFLGGLFNMLGDPNQEIRQQADTALFEFLREIKTQPSPDLAKMVPILVTHCGSKDEFTKYTAIKWLQTFIELGKEQCLDYYADILASILPCIAHQGPRERDIRDRALQTNKQLLEIVYSTDVDFEIGPICTTVTEVLNHEKEETCLTSIQWFSMLLDKMPEKLLKHLDTIFPALLSTLSYKSDHVVQRDLEVLAQICRHEQCFPKFMNELIQIFKTERVLLKHRGSLIICTLCTLLQPQKIYRAFAEILEHEKGAGHTPLSSTAQHSAWGGLGLGFGGNKHYSLGTATHAE